MPVGLFRAWGEAQIAEEHFDGALDGDRVLVALPNRIVAGRRRFDRPQTIARPRGVAALYMLKLPSHPPTSPHAGRKMPAR
jgi:hypothetical protein